MKYILSLNIILFAITIARADLSVKIGLTGQNTTNLLMGIVDRIAGNKCRQDIFFEGQNAESQIINLESGEGFKLVPDKKIAVKSFMDQFAQTNAIVTDAIKDTGKSENINGYEAEIYTYANTRGGDYTLWITQEFPNLGKIKQDLAKRDRLNMATRSGLFHLSTLPGMLLKCHVDSNMPTNATFQVIINDDPIDESIFEVPKNYTWQKRSASITNTNK